MSAEKSKGLALSRDQEITASKYFGKHVTPQKALVLFITAILIAAMPMIIGMRHYADIPEVVLTGIRDAAGRDDSMPRAVLVYAVPGLFVLLTVICHAQLWIHQKRQKLPKASVRLLGRWVTAIISLFFCSWIEHSAAGAEHSTAFVLNCVIGVVFALLGAQVFDCKDNSMFALKADYVRRNENTRRISHRLVGGALLLGSIIILLPTMFTDAPVIAAVIAAAVLAGLSFAVLPAVCRKIPHS